MSDLLSSEHHKNLISNNPSHLLSIEEIQDIEDLYKNSLATETRRSYESTLKGYKQYCKNKNSDMIYSHILIAAYLTHLKNQNKSKSLIDIFYSAIKRDMKLHNIVFNQQDKQHTDMLYKGIIRSLADKKVTQKKALTDDLLKMMVAQIDITTLRGIRDKALLLIGFSTFNRRSELSNLKTDDIEENEQGFIIHIRKSKTDQTGQGFIKVIKKTGSLFCPVSALNNWITSAQIKEGYIFRAINKSDRVQENKLTGQYIAHVVKKRAESIGYNPVDFAGHSLRRGGITTAVRKGARIDSIISSICS